jgi:hypothetical protein
MILSLTDCKFSVTIEPNAMIALLSQHIRSFSHLFCNNTLPCSREEIVKNVG